MKKELDTLEKFKSSYTKDKFWEKVSRNAQKAGTKLIFFALCFFYSLQKESTPVWAKSTIVGALGYFISLIDAVPDFVPIVGYSDDLFIILAAFTVVTKYIDEECKEKAKGKFREIFNSDYVDESNEGNAT